VVVMLNMTSREISLTPASAASRAGLATAQAELAATEAELEALRLALAEQEHVSRRIADPGARERMRLVTQSQQDLTERMERQQDNLDTAAKSQAEVNQIAEAMQAMQEQLQRAQQQLAQANAALKQEVSRRERKLSLPKQRKATKTEVVWFLKGGRLTSYVKLGPGGILALNDTEFEQRRDEHGEYVVPKASAGTPVDIAAEPGRTVAHRLAGLNPGQHYIAIGVWPDSFNQFQVVRNALVESGFEYRLLPVSDQRKIYTSGAVDANVQGGR
jgi:hypothetical protein